MAVEMMCKKRFTERGRTRAGLTLVEVLIAIIIISVAMGAVLNVFSHSLRLTVETSRHSSGLMQSYAAVERNFFVKDLSGVPNAALAGKPINIVFSAGGASSTTLEIKPYNVGGDWPLRVYRF